MHTFVNIPRTKVSKWKDQNRQSNTIQSGLTTIIMKKNITIDIFGQRYAIDEKAYELLNRYLDSVKRYYANAEGGEKTADNIERRIAELLRNKKSEGATVVTLEDVRDIIGKIGNPYETDYDTQQDSDAYAAQDAYDSTDTTEEYRSNGILDGLKGRYLYRDTDDKVLGGVCSGVANFIGSDSPAMVRLATVVLFFALLYLGNLFDIQTAWTLPLIYIIMWAIVPLPRSTEDRLKMKGQEVTPENINEERLKEHSDDREAAIRRNSNNNGCLSLLLKTALILLLLPFLFAFSVCAFVVFAAILVLINVPSSVFPYWTDADGALEAAFISDNSGMMLTVIFSILVLIAIPVYFIIKALRHDSKGFTSRTAFITLLVWIVFLVITIVSGISLTMNYKKLQRDYRQQQHLMQVQDTVDTQEDDTGETDTIGWQE